MELVATEPNAAPDAMKCMEVWGGNRAVDGSFSRPGLDVWVWSNPHDDAHVSGGDVHLLSSCASGRITRMLIADVCAHGQAFSAMADGMRELMKHNVNRIKQNRLVKSFSSSLCGCASHGAYASALIATYFAPTKSFALCNTGHPPPFLYRADQKQWSVLKRVSNSVPSTDQLPIDVVDECEYQQFSFRLKTGDMVLCYSNSLTECRDEARQFIGVDGLLKKLSETDSEDPSSVVPQLISQVKSVDADNLADADATIMLCRATDNGVGWKNNLLAPFRLLRSVSDKTHLQ